ncbi:isopeptide-forming domain-containing fimbrial protein [Bifidobacterium sp. SO1]|uniref:isopeptide-forming domain-containing fimbrial protein n=1 Tax=Bifidobacterium sp. SO1 TaxID=2809029 RepID=UPI001BDC84BA|nr:isopeptide-forming domain-containing fimbrial protein [Bifidobacterium sp. SO1]MBT1162855.1 isopeptide-forming domain-containing fimbrial protein [Bifidobacterium sp. SO1]
MLTLTGIGLTSMPAMAAPVTGGNITVNAGTSGNVAGHTVKYLEIAKYTNVSFDADGNPTGLNLESTLSTADNTKVTQLVAGIDSKYTTEKQATYSWAQWIALNWKGTDADIYSNKLANDEMMAALAKKLANTADGIAKSATKEVKGADKATTLTIPVDYGEETDNNYGGLYLLLDQNATDTARKANAMIVPSAIQSKDGKTVLGKLGEQTLGVVNMKNKVVSITKQRQDVLPTVGDLVTFTINTDAPDFTGIDQPKLIIWDNPSEGLDQPKADTFTVTAGDIKLTAGTDYTLNLKSNRQDGTVDPNAFNITFTNPTALAGKKITVTYKAAVTQNAFSANTQTNSAGDDTYSNNVIMEYSNDPQSSSTSKPEDTVEGSLAGFDIHKVDYDNKTMELTGAEFQIHNDQNQLMKFTKLTVDGKTVFMRDDNGTITNVGGDGLGGKQAPISIEGLDRGTYTVTETKAPAKYVLGQGSQQLTFKVTIAADASTHDKQKITVTNNPGIFTGYVETAPAADDTTDANTVNGTIRVANVTSLDRLPDTGATGYRIFGAVAIAFAIGGACFIVRKRLEA